MLVRIVVPIALLLALAGFAFGGAPVATVSSSGSFDLHGSTVKTEGIPYWPVVAGDEIATHGSSAIIRFHDGTSVSLGENSRARVETIDNVLVFRLSGGTMQVNAAPVSAIKFFQGGQNVAVHSGYNPQVGSGTQVRPMKVSLPPLPAPVSGK
jgi:hypothetical protein